MKIIRYSILLLSLIICHNLYAITAPNTTNVRNASFTNDTNEASNASDTINAIKLIRKIETQYQGDTSHGISQMNIKTSAWERTLTMESWTIGRERFLTRILKPKKEKGTASLKVETNMWNYLPKIDRLVKIPSSLMGESWMGSHLTNDDLIKQDKIDLLFDLKVASQTTEEVTIIGIPKHDAAVVWGKIVYKVNLIKQIPIYIDYFDEEEEAVRRMSFSDVVKIGDRWIPRIMTIKPFDKPKEYTEFIYKTIEFNINVPQSRFTLRELRKH